MPLKKSIEFPKVWSECWDGWADPFVKKLIEQYFDDFCPECRGRGKWQAGLVPRPDVPSGYGVIYETCSACSGSGVIEEKTNAPKENQP